jgi:hypothetical protein
MGSLHHLQGISMKKYPPIQTALLCMILLSVFAVQAETISKHDYKSCKTRIS